MKNKKESGSLFGLLTRNFLLFALTLFLITAFIYFLWNLYLDSTFFLTGIGDTASDTAFISDEEYYRLYDNSWKIWLLFIPLFALASGLFIRHLNRTIRRPLDKLNDAVLAQANGHPVLVGDCGGTREIRRIGESFDRLTTLLSESEKQRKELDEGRQKLIADISHDLKTPITVISGYAAAINDDKVTPEEMKRYLSAIRSKSDELAELINAFHEYSKIDHPDFSLHSVRTDLCEYSREYLAKKYDEIDLAGFTLKLSIPEEPIFCMLDEFQFKRVFENLLSNSIRHNRLGTILFFSISKVKDTAVIRIGDNGIGIPPERAEKIFEPFFTGNEARNRTSPGQSPAFSKETGQVSGQPAVPAGQTGSGLGLSISRRIVELEGGTIQLSPTPSQGLSSEFLIRLPLTS